MQKFTSNAEISSQKRATNEQIWEEIFSKKQWGKYPPESLIRFIARNFYGVKDRNAIKVLELGLGTGSNLWFAAREGFCVSGIEFSKNGISRFKERMRAENLESKINEILQGDYLTRLDDLKDGTFDAVIDERSLCCNDFDKTREIFLKAIKKLKRGGKFYSATMSDELFGATKDFAAPRDGIYTHLGKLRFENKANLAKLYAAEDFKINSIYTTQLEKDGVILDKNFIIEGEKI